jgi:hypothetical protein
LNLQNYVWNIQESHNQLLKDTISQGQYAREIHTINERMKKSGFNEGERSNALNEGEQNAIANFKIKASNN